MLAHDAVDEGPIGAYRRRDVRAGLHVAPHWKAVPALMDQLLKWLNGPAEQLPAIFSSAILHLRFVEIHPFRDGNGRLTRLLATWELYRKGFDTLHVFALDEYFLNHRNLYIRNLQRVQVEKKDLGGWLEFVAEALLDTLERVEKRITAIGIRNDQPLSLTTRQEKLLILLREKGQMGIREIAIHLKVTTPGAHYVLKPLIKAGLIARQGAHKQSRYALVK
jgi:Fic family protein